MRELRVRSNRLLLLAVQSALSTDKSRSAVAACGYFRTSRAGFLGRAALLLPSAGQAKDFAITLRAAMRYATVV